ncbi:phage tail protein [Paenibacillus sp. FSL H7-0940]|uniref:phage tail protein n=1 Tax=Paenibacillus sp. FSL H7-0940 TaxID=2921443 RepID=UPI0030EC5AF4
MPQETDRLKLPLPLGNENVTRESINGIFEKIDAGVASQADLDALREAVSQMDIPDASLTQKGKVQLSSKTDGTSEAVAATEKAVRDARVAAINAASTDATTKANAAVAPIISLDSSNLVQNSSANLGLYGWSDYGSAPWSVTAGTNFRTLKYFQVTGAVAANSYAVLDSNPTNVIAGTYNLQAMFYTLGMTTGILLIEVKNASDDITINSLVADANSNWHRKSKTVTIPSGVTSVKLRLVVAGGASGVPGSVKAISRIKFSAGAVDVPYTAEADDLALFQSGVDAKNGIVGAINAKGGNASTSDTWVTLMAKINAIEQGQYAKFSPDVRGNYINVPAGFSGQVGSDIATFAAGTKVISLFTNSAGNMLSQCNYGAISVAFSLRDNQGVLWPIHTPHGNNTGLYFIMSVLFCQIDLVARSISTYLRVSTDGAYYTQGPFAPSNFNTQGPIKLVYAVYDNTWAQSREVYYKVTLTSIVSG